MKKKLASYAVIACLLLGCSSNESRSFRTDYFGIDIDSRGYIAVSYTHLTLPTIA